MSVQDLKKRYAETYKKYQDNDSYESELVELIEAGNRSGITFDNVVHNATKKQTSVPKVKSLTEKQKKMAATFGVSTQGKSPGQVMRETRIRATKYNNRRKIG